MKFQLYSIKLFCLSGLLFLLAACDPTENTEKQYGEGVFISNEGGYDKNNASVSYYEYSSDSIINDVYHTANNKPLGDVLQSIYCNGDKVFLMVNNSNKVVVMNRSTFKEITTIGGLTLPRYMIVNNGTGYITCWGDNAVYPVDVNTYVLGEPIAVGSGPEKMLIHNNKLLVANSGGYGKDSTLSVIDLSLGNVEKTIVVGDNPRDIEVDKNGDIWVLCYGIEDWSDNTKSTPSKIVKLDGTTLEPIKGLILTDMPHAAVLDMNKEGDRLYFGGGYSFGGIYQISIDSSSATELVTDFAYGFSVEKSRNELFVAIATSWTAAGQVKRYNLSGDLLGTYTAGIGPNGVASLKNTQPE